MDRNALLAACRLEFLRVFRHATSDALMLAAGAIFRKADFSYSDAESRSLFDAHRILQQKSSELHAQLQVRMALLLDRSLETAYSTFRPASQNVFNSDTLALVEAGYFEDQLRLDEITTRFRNVAEQQLRDLNIRIALVFEQRAIKERENPFRPWLFTRCIINAVESVCPRADLTMILCRQIAENFEESIALIYNALNACLEENGIAAKMHLPATRMTEADNPLAGGQADAASVAEGNGATPFGKPERPVSSTYDATEGDNQSDRDEFGTSMNALTASAPIEDLMNNIRRIVTRMPPTENNPAGRSTSMLYPHAQADVANTSVLTSHENRGDRLRPFFAGESSLPIFGTSAPNVRSVPHLDSPVDGVISTPLAQLLLRQQPGTAANAMQPMQNHIVAQRTALVGAAVDIRERMTIDVMARLFEFILHDEQIPAEIRAHLGRLQFRLLKMALSESTLLTDKGHPVRMLINRIGAVSTGRQERDPDDVHISAEISRMVDVLLANDSVSSAQFASASDQFDAFVAKEFRAENTAVNHAAQLIENIQTRTSRLRQITAQLDAILSGLVLHDFLRDFLLSTWIHVIEHAERTTDTTSTAKAAARYKLLVPDLLWSIALHIRPNDNPQLLALIPVVVQTVRDGLSMIGWPESRQQPVLDWLASAHRTALCNNNETVVTQSLAALQNDFGQFLRQSQPLPTDSTAGYAALQQVILDAVMHEAGDSLALFDRMTTTGLTTANDMTNAAFGPIIDSVASLDRRAFEQPRIGTPLERNLDGTPEAARLKWIDHHAAIFVLTVEGQHSPCLIGAQSFQRMLATGRLRFMESDPLFERAVDSVMQSATSAQESA